MYLCVLIYIKNKKLMIIKNYETFLENSKTMWGIIPQSVKDLHSLFKKQDKKLFVVGGAVRDFLNNENPKDFDLCTDATPDEVLSIIGKKWKTTVQGKSFGVIVVYTEDQPKGMEIATFREDIYDDKLGLTRNPDVKFSTIDKDVQRRDLTINGLFFDLDKKEIIDLVGGVEDLKNSVSRFIGDPEMRIKEDGLRILRLLRFNCRYGFDIDEKAASAIKKYKSKLRMISRERIWTFSGDNCGEIYKGWKQSKDFSKYLELINRFDLWEEILPGVKINREIIKSKYLDNYLANILIYNDISKLVNKLVQEFKMEVDTVRKIVFLISLLNLSETNVIDLYKKRIVANISNDEILDWYRMKNISSDIFMAFLKYKPSVNSLDLMSKGFSGKELGDEIKRLEIEKFKQMIK